MLTKINQKAKVVKHNMQMPKNIYHTSFIVETLYKNVENLVHPFKEKIEIENLKHLLKNSKNKDIIIKKIKNAHKSIKELMRIKEMVKELIKEMIEQKKNAKNGAIVNWLLENQDKLEKLIDIIDYFIDELLLPLIKELNQMVEKSGDKNV